MDKRNLSAIILRPHGEVQPIISLRTPLDEQFIKLLLLTISDIQQDSRVADGLFDAEATDIYGTARQMVAARHATDGLIHGFASET